MSKCVPYMRRGKRKTFTAALLKLRNERREWYETWKWELMSLKVKMDGNGSKNVRTIHALRLFPGSIQVEVESLSIQCRQDGIIILHTQCPLQC